MRSSIWGGEGLAQGCWAALALVVARRVATRSCQSMRRTVASVVRLLADLRRPMKVPAQALSMGTFMQLSFTTMTAARPAKAASGQGKAVSESR